MPCLEAIKLQDANIDLEYATPQDILRWAVYTYYPRLTMSTAFGVEGCVLMSMLADIEPNVRVFNLDTGYQFPETLEMRDIIWQRYGVNVELVQPEQSVGAFETEFGGPLYNRDPHECCRLRKVVPLRR